jgi:glucose-1-phosphate thymidylyltransferase
MKGIILAGGLGTRLLPLTKIQNKHSLNIYDKPMIFYPIETLVRGGVTELAIVLGEHGGDGILKLIGDGKQFGLDTVQYFVQHGEGGIASALNLAKSFCNNEHVIVCLGDNIFEDTFYFSDIFDILEKDEAHIYIKEVPEPQRFGVIKFNEDKTIEQIIEKPEVPPSSFAVTGLYIFPGSSLFKVIKTLRPSERGELEVTDINNWYINRGKMVHTEVNGEWTDAGTFDSLLYANIVMAKNTKHKKHTKKFDSLLNIL